MTTFKNNAKYAELLLTYLDVAIREDVPVTVPEVLQAFEWRFKGGSLLEASQGTRLQPETSGDVFPDGLAVDIAREWPSGREALALRSLLVSRSRQGKMRSRSLLARIGTYVMLTAMYDQSLPFVRIRSGMKSIYHLHGQMWVWASEVREGGDFELLELFGKELTLGLSAAARQDLETVSACWERFRSILRQSRLRGLLMCIQDMKNLIRLAGSGPARALSKANGAREVATWENTLGLAAEESQRLTRETGNIACLWATVGPLRLRVLQNMAVFGSGPVRYALSKSDMERLHQLLMSTASCIVGVCAQATVGTSFQREKALKAVEVTERNVGRIVRSARLVPLGDEVLVCKGYRRAYTAHLGYLAGPMCLEETKILEQEAAETAPPGVLDVEGFLHDARKLDAASSLNASKVFKICPAPDVSPGGAMIDRIKQIGNSNIVDSEMIQEFAIELKTQILRAYVRAKKGRLSLRVGKDPPQWLTDYNRGEFDKVPSAELDEFLAWEGDATMPDVSQYDPANWKDSGLGADTIEEALDPQKRTYKLNMVTRLVFDDECPMPGRQVLSSDHVIKFFIKAEGHKDPARGIFSANLTDRQAQSWMEKGVQAVAKHHPSFMIGQEVDVREAKVIQLTTRPRDKRWMALYYSFDISGWSAKMPAEPQRISHDIWARLYGGHLFEHATKVNEGSFIYLDMDGYNGWYRNTHSNLEGFNGKEMTMVLVALLSLSVRMWRAKVVERGVMTAVDAEKTSALLFAYIDDGLSRIDLPKAIAIEAFDVYKQTVIETFAKCGFAVEVSKCFPSDRFAIFLNEVYLAGRHVVHGVRAAMGISSEPTERHTSLVERVTSVSTGCRGAVMAGLNPLSGLMLMAYHTMLHIVEWTAERDPVVMASWCVAPRAWGGLGLPNMLQLFISGSGSAFEESVATMQAFARYNLAVKKAFITLARTDLTERDAVAVLTAPLSGKVSEGYMVDSRVAVAVRRGLQEKMEDGRISKYAARLLRYANTEAFRLYAESIVPFDPREVLQEQMLTNLAEAHPHTIFSGFARRLEKSTTVRMVVGKDAFTAMIDDNRREAVRSVEAHRSRMMW